MDPLTIQFHPPRRSALIAGGDDSVRGVLDTLVDAGWPVTLVAPRLSDALRARHASGAFTWHARPAHGDDVAQAALVFAAGSPAHNRRVESLAAARDRPFCDLATGGGDFHLPAVDRGPDLWRHAQVCLVGAGPGDPGLLTRDGEHALRSADVVLHDRLVGAGVLDLVPPTTRRIFVGKRRDHHHYRQNDLNALMIERAHAGQRVVRLKGGDPFMFGRGGEELEALGAAGIDARVIPGVSAGSACATYADIPLTHRDYASSCQFITAHGRAGPAEHDWAALVRERHTLVIYMGVMALRELCPRLVEHGLAPETPAALIERGTLPDQRVLTGTVDTLPAIARRHELTSPAVLVVGAVVALRDRVARCRPARAPAAMPRKRA